jgi:uncharacterized protein
LSSLPPAPSLLERLRQGIALYNRGEYFECHEVLETAWLAAVGKEKLFLQGLIQIAVSFHHLRRGNFSGSSRLLRAGIDKLSRAAESQQQLDLPALLGELHNLPDRIDAGEIPPEFPAPEIRLFTTA